MSRDNDILERCLKAGSKANYCRWVKGDKVLSTGARSIADLVTFRNDVTAMRLLVEHGVDLSGSVITKFVSSIQAPQDLPLMGDDGKLVENEGWTTLLHLACGYGYIDLIRIILDAGHVSSPNTRDFRGRTGLHTTISGIGVLDVAELLIDKGADIDANYQLGLTPLAFAAVLNNLEVLKLLLDHSAAIDATDRFGLTDLYHASLRNHSTIVTALAARGIQIDLRNNDGKCAFSKAASLLKTDIKDILTECGGDTVARDNNGCTALARATMAKNIPLITHLLQLGVDIDAEERRVDATSRRNDSQRRTTKPPSPHVY